ALQSSRATRKISFRILIGVDPIKLLELQEEQSQYKEAAELMGPNHIYILCNQCKEYSKSLEPKQKYPKGTNITKMKILHVVLVYGVTLLSVCGCRGTSTKNTEIDPNKIITEKEQLIDPEQNLSDSLKCNITVVRKTGNKIDELTTSEIKMFLFTFSKGCSRNIEYSEYSNEILFKVLINYPSQFIDCIDLNPDIEFEYILSELANPLLDIDRKKLITVIKEANGKPDIKLKIIESIEKAME
nr:hypothetical protein [Bacteroidales bacterium]